MPSYLSFHIRAAQSEQTDKKPIYSHLLSVLVEQGTLSFFFIMQAQSYLLCLIVFSVYLLLI